jgi:hypothetical protein
MANVIVPWPGPVPEPGASNVVMIACEPTKGAFRKFRKPSLAPLEAANADAKSTVPLRNMFRTMLDFIKMFFLS